MAVTIPTLNDIYNNILNDYATELEVDVSTLGKSYQVRAKVQAATIYTCYLALSAVQRNIFYDLAEEDQLIRYGLQILGRTPAPATQGIYTIEVNGTIGATVPAQSQFRGSDDITAAGFIFIVDTEKVLTATTDTLQVRALTAGTDSQLFVSDVLNAVQPLVNVNSNATVTVVDSEPTAEESIDSYRDDVVEAAKLEPNGGAPSDYRLWASDVPEVRTVYPYAKLGSAGDVEVYIEATPENTKPLGIIGEPTETTIDDVYKVELNGDETGALIIDSISLKGRKPIGVFNILPFSVSPLPVDLYFVDLSDESVSSDIRTVIDALLYDVRPFIAGADDITERNDTLTISTLIAATIQLLAGTGVSYTTLTMEVDGNVVTSYQFEEGFYPYLRTIYNDGVPI